MAWLEVTVLSCRDLKNVNWRYGELKAFAVVWVDSSAKCSTRVDLNNGEYPIWDEKVAVPLPSFRLYEAVLHVQVIHANAGERVKPLVSSARLLLRDVLEDARIGTTVSSTLSLKRPSGRPQGKLHIRVAVKDPGQYYDIQWQNPSPAVLPSHDTYSSAGGYSAGQCLPVWYPWYYNGGTPTPTQDSNMKTNNSKKKNRMGMGGGRAQDSNMKTNNSKKNRMGMGGGQAPAGRMRYLDPLSDSEGYLSGDSWSSDNGYTSDETDDESY